MKIFLTIVLLILTIAIIISAVLVQNPEDRNVDVFQEMIETPSYGAFEPNSNFKDGKTLQAPVEGTVMRGELSDLHTLAMDIPDSLSFEDSVYYKLEYLNLASQDSTQSKDDIIARGKQQYDIFCGVCHGVSGIGNGIVVLKGYPVPPSLLFPKYVNMLDARIYKTITEGFNNMSSYASQVSREDRWKIIAYIRNLQIVENDQQDNIQEVDSVGVSNVEIIDSTEAQSIEPI